MAGPLDVRIWQEPHSEVIQIEMTVEYSAPLRMEAMALIFVASFTVNNGIMSIDGFRQQNCI